MKRWPGSRWAVVTLLIGLAVLSSGRAIGNGFAFDDVPIVQENSQIHELAPPWTYAQQSYWPPDDLGDAYRPWTIWCLAIQWAIGGGAPWVFHMVNTLLTMGTTLLVLTLGLEILPPLGAAVAAALFAVHPVHVEATGNIVGQGELWLAMFVLIASIWYLRDRRAGALSLPCRLGLAALLVLAAAAKEQGIVLPGILALLEWAIVPTFRAERLGPRIRSVAPAFFLMAVVGGGFLAARYGVLGDLGGGPPAAGLETLGFVQRSQVMAPLVWQWLRLLAWPTSLLSQYSPPAYGGPPHLTGPTWLGFALLATGAVATLAGRRPWPAIATGLGWIAIALLPVSNFLFPTGVLIAERTLFLPSVGAVLIAGAIVVGSGRLEPLARGVVSLAVIGLVAAGAIRSWNRQPVWHDNVTLFRQTVIDEPRSYRGFFVLGRELVRQGDPSGGARAYQTAGTLYQGDYRVFEEWGQIERAAGHCDRAIPIFERGVKADPIATVVRSRLLECFLALGDSTRARAVAAEGIRLGATEFEASLVRASRGRSAAPEPPRSSR